MQFVMNNAMEKIKNKKPKNNLIFNQDKIKNIFCPNFIKVYDCIIISDVKIDLERKEFDKVIEAYGGKTYYEASCNETYINYYIENEDLYAEDILPIVPTIFDVWSKSLKSIECTSFCFVITSDENRVNIRFNKVRENEQWLVDNIEKYDEAVGYIVI